MPRGLFSCRKILKNKKAFKKNKKKRYSLKADNSPFLRGIVLSKFNAEARQPNSGFRKCVKFQIIKNNKISSAFCPNDGAIKFISEHDEILVTGCGGKLGKQRGDLPGVPFKVVKVSDLSLKELVRGKITK